ncbi:DUF4226 domain-containing protein [Mycobacterium paragordonae]|uniref:DUF4226 domain-containing protein n=1 Tax=Mycobacterium paragordonae TaxID=1389713 RepID=UPI0012E292B4|nr:DUF4226 domain-containing protein [Mycobacterium paragordonae]
MAGVDPGLQSFAGEVIDRLLARGAELFPEGEQSGGLVTPLAGAVAPPGGATAAGQLGDAVAQWGQRRLTLQRLDEQGAQIVARAAAAAVEGRGAVQRLREQARAQVEAIMPLADTPAGARLLVATLDQALAQLQQHVAASKQANAGAAAQLRELATLYQGSV